MKVLATRDSLGRFPKGASRGANHPRFKGGSLSWNGYRLIMVGEKQIREHRHLWEQAFGPIPDGLILHHKNGVKTDNRLENLELVTRQEHPRMHFKRSSPPCSVCGVPSQARHLCNRHWKQWRKYGCIPDPATLRRSGRRPSGYARHP